MSIWVVVPTRGDHPDLLQRIVDGCGHPVVVVTTLSGVRVPEGAGQIHDLGTTNISRWWNRGITYATFRGARYVAVLNDDVRVGQGALDMMAEALRCTRAPLCWSAHRMTGWAWMLDLASMVRPDERFAWYYGDDDLGRQAGLFGGAVEVDVDIEHLHPDVTTWASPDLQALARADRVTFDRKWGLARGAAQA